MGCAYFRGRNRAGKTDQNTLKFSEVIGQTAAKQRLRTAYREGRIAHALLFAGAEGSGIFPLALAFAQYISCPNKTDEDSCGECSTCKKIDHLQFADMHFSFPFFNLPPSTRKTTCDDHLSNWRDHMLANPYSSNDQWRDQITKAGENKTFHISVYEAANVVNKLSLKSYEGGYKFHIIWMAQYLKTDTANKLLKIIEEPPENTIFILLASSVEDILPTILSRVQRINIPKITDDEMTLALVNMGHTPVEASSLAHFTDGNWNKVQLLLNENDPNAFFAEQFQAWMRHCYKKSVKEIIDWANKMHELSRDNQTTFLTYALDQIRQNLMLNYTGNQMTRMNNSEQKFASNFSPFINHHNAEDLLEAVTDAHRDITRNAYAKLILTDLSFKLHYMLTRKDS